MLSARWVHVSFLNIKVHFNQTHLLTTLSIGAYLAKLFLRLNLTKYHQENYPATTRKKRSEPVAGTWENPIELDSMCIDLPVRPREANFTRISFRIKGEEDPIATAPAQEILPIGFPMDVYAFDGNSQDSQVAVSAMQIIDNDVYSLQDIANQTPG